MRATHNLVVLLAVITLTACSSGKAKRPEYQSAEYFESLQLPPDLTLHKTTAEMEIPEPRMSPQAEHQEKSNLNNAVVPVVKNQAVLPEFSNMRVRSEGSMYFLEVDLPPEKVWPVIEGFWENEGISLLQNRPMLGFVQTDWTKQLQDDKKSGFFSRIFSKLQPEFRDRFRMRVEPAAGRTKTHIFIAHSGVMLGLAEDENAILWRRRSGDIELEREILSRLGLYVGLSENQAESLLKDYKPYQSSVQYTENLQGEESEEVAVDHKADRGVELTMRGSMDLAWYRTIRALDRMEMADISDDREAGVIRFTAPSTVKAVVVEGGVVDENEDDDDFSGSSWSPLANLFKSGPDDKQEFKEAEQFVLLLTEMPGYVSFELQDTNGSEATGARATYLRAALARALE